MELVRPAGLVKVSRGMYYCSPQDVWDEYKVLEFPYENRPHIFIVLIWRRDIIMVKLVILYLKHLPVNSLPDGAGRTISAMETSDSIAE